jgi:hypothetical protein
MKIDEQVIMRFFRGECTEDEKKQVAAYLESHKEILDGFFDEEDWTQSLNKLPEVTSPYNEEVLLQTIQAKLYGSRRGLLRYMRPLMKWSVAACITVLAIGTLVYYMQRPVNDIRTIVSNDTVNPAINDSVVWTNNSSTSESRYLSDGSLVWLEPGSVLRYKIDFDPGKRWLHLEGKAKFKVAKNKKRPFTVFAKNVGTTAVGTIFTVSNNDKHKCITVKLEEGKVLVQDMNHPADTLYLLPGEYCAFDGKALQKTDSLYYVMKSAGSSVVHDKKYYFIDSTCQLDASHVIFKNTELPSVFKALNKLYEVKIVYKNMPDSVLSKSLYSGKFIKAKMKAADVLRIVSFINDLNCQRVDSKTYLISSK